MYPRSTYTRFSGWDHIKLTAYFSPGISSDPDSVFNITVRIQTSEIRNDEITYQTLKNIFRIFPSLLLISYSFH